MDSTHGSQSPDIADKKLSFPKSSNANEKPNRKYRHHSTISRSVSPSSDGSPRHVKIPSPAFSGEDPTKNCDVPLRRRNGGRELDMEFGRSRFEKGGDSLRHSDWRSYKSSSDHHRHGDNNRYHKRADEVGERGYYRSSWSGRESRSGGTYSDRSRHGSEHDKLGDYRRSTDKYAQEKSGDGHRHKDEDRDDRKKHKDKESSIDRDTSGRRHVNRDGGSRDDMSYSKSLRDHKNDTTVSAEEAIGRGRHSNAGPESGGSPMKETQKTNIKDLGQQKGDTMEKRKHSDKEFDKYRDGFSKELSGKDNRKDNESSPKKSRSFNAERDRNKVKDDQMPSKPTILLDERPPSRPKLPQETMDKVISESAQSSNKAEGSHDFDAAKVAAMKAAELVNKNLIPGGYMSTDQKKKLLWGSKKTTIAEEMKPISEDPVISSNLKDIHCSSICQVDEIKDENLVPGFSSDLDTVRHKHKPVLQMKPISDDPVISSNLKDIHCSSFRQVDEIKDEKFDPGFSSDSDSVRHKHKPVFNMLLWLKSVAVDHYWAETSSRNSQESENQIIVVRKLLSLSHSDAPWKKRKLNQLLEETVTAASDLSRGKDQCSTRRKYTIPSLHSGLVNCADSEGRSDLIQNPQSSVRLSNFFDNAPQKRILIGLLFQPDELEWSSPLDEEVELLLDSDDPVGGSNLSSPTKSFLQTPQHKPIKLLMSGNNYPRKQVCISRHKGVPPIFKHDDLVNVANSSKKARKFVKPQKSSKPIDFFSDDFCGFPIPVGPRFQAAIPERSCKPNCSADGDADIDNSDKWLGTCIWPIEDRNAETSREFIGKGRPSSCSCNSPGSTQCIKLHICQSRLQLQQDLGSAFFDWKFDEMGEEVVKSWTTSEQKSFELLVKNNPTSKNMSFWKPALKLFSSKSRASIVSYYFNVVVLRRISRQTRLGCKVVDTDDDETDEGVGRSDTKARYLTVIR